MTKQTTKQTTTKRPKPTTTPDNTPVFGHADPRTLDAIDRVADQMLMPRSWVVSQIVREWAETRAAEIAALETSWNGSTREHLARHALEMPIDPFQLTA